MFERWRRQRARQEFERVSSLIAYSPLDEVLDELDEIDLRGFSPIEVATWLNNRAYVLALLGSTAEALEHLRDAEELLDGADATDHKTRYELEVLLSCIVGTRGIAFLHAGSLDEAEANLNDAFDQGARHLDSTDAGIAYQQKHLAAERLWWLARIAEKRKDAVRRVELLRRAAAFEGTVYGDKAREALSQQ